MKKILFISDHGDPLLPLGSKQAGGQNNYVKQLALGLDALGYAVDVVTHWSDATLPATEKLGKYGRVYRFSAGHLEFIEKNKMYELLPTLFNEMAQQLDFSQYEALHTHYWMSGVLALSIQQQVPLHWVHTNHSLAAAKEQATGIHDAHRFKWEQLIMQQANIVLATTPSEKQLIEELIKNPARVEVIPIGVAAPYLYAMPHYNIASDYFFYAGRLEETKGIFDLFQAFRRFTQLTPEKKHIKLFIAGGCSHTVDTQRLQPRAMKLKRAISGLEHRIFFLGPKNEDQLKILYSHAIATIMPSHYESFGMVAAEAQACGSAVIATKVGGLKNVVREGITGFHMAKSQANQLAFLMRYLLEKPQQLEQLRKQARQCAKQNYSWPKIAKKIAQLYEEKGVLAHVSSS